MSSYKKLLKCLLLFYLLLVFLFCISPFGQAATYYVAPGGDDYNPGTEAKPWRTLDKAADTMEAGDTVYVKAGSYSGFDVSRSGTLDNYISYLAYPGATPEIGQIYFQYGASYNRFVGFEITPASGGGVIMDHNNDRNIISNCHIHNSSSVGVDLSGGSDFNLIEDCEVHDCYYAFHTSGSTNKGNIFRGNECYNLSDDGFNFSPSTKDTQVINNVIYNVDRDGSGGADGIHLYDDGSAIVRGNIVYIDGASTGGVFWIHGGANHSVENNTFVGLPGFSATYGGIVCVELASNVILKNNIGYSSSNSVGVLMMEGSSTIDDYNDWFNKDNPSKCIYYNGEWKSVSQYQSEDKRGLHCISQNPKFIDIENPPYDFQLQADSPCKGAGENGVDIGAYGVGPEETIPPSKQIKVLNRPNPFRAGKENTLIVYNLSQPSNVTITIYDSLGQEVWLRSYQAGENGGRKENIVPWDGRNSSGNVVANGAYVCRIWIEREMKSIVRKIAVAK